MSSTAPMIVHSILLNGTEQPAEPGPAIAHNFASLRLHHPRAEHRIHTDAPAREFLAGTFGPEVVAAWDALIPLSYRADLLRYALLHAFGGLYLDVSIQLLAPITRGAPAKLHVFRDVENVAPWILATSIIAAPPGHGLFERCIERICAHVRDDHYGQNPLCPTGPNLFGQMAAQHVPLGSFQSGHSVPVNRSRRQRFYAYFMGEKVVATCVKANRAGIDSLGFGHADDYNRAWHRGRIYRNHPRALGIKAMLTRLKP